MGTASEYLIDLSHFPDFTDAGGYLYEGTTTDSSPSPVRLFSQMDQQIEVYEPFPNSSDSYQDYDLSPTSPLVEFTDLTAPYNEDRRRRRPHATKDKQTISSMHMRRRAQNRASQRAFRERKEKHAQDLQRQLDDLEAKHQELLTSYRQLDSTNSNLTTELDDLRRKITILQSSRSDSADHMMSSEPFDPYDFDQSVESAAARLRDCS
ncbi:hypothetical protein MMC15_006226 [Xylographa vitiligo]|nr:hypothetical protein [Xylographa vitiligo]